MKDLESITLKEAAATCRNRTDCHGCPFHNGGMACKLGCKPMSWPYGDDDADAYNYDGDSVITIQGHGGEHHEVACDGFVLIALSKPDKETGKRRLEICKENITDEEIASAFTGAEPLEMAMRTAVIWEVERIVAKQQGADNRLN